MTIWSFLDEHPLYCFALMSSGVLLVLSLAYRVLGGSKRNRLR